MTDEVDLDELARRESEQTEWKENVADPDDVVATLCAFANDIQNLGGGYVVCGVRESRDEHGFPRLDRVGLTPSRLKEIEGRVLTACREHVSPPLRPRLSELPSDEPSRRILVFIQPATSGAHTFRRKDDTGKYYVRIGRSTREARNGTLRDLLTLRGAMETWDHRPCQGATVEDLDLISLRDALQQMGAFSASRGLDPFLTVDAQLHAMVPSLVVAEPLTGVLRPRNFAMLLFGRQAQRFIPGAVSVFSVYPGTDRSDPHAERQDVDGNLLEQARRLRELLDIQSYTAFDKDDPKSPNAIKYPKKALYEALINALAHRDYEMHDPTRLTVFADRIEIVSPGALVRGVDIEKLRAGEALPRWRNQALAWFLSRLELAQAEGQGIPTILRTMKAEGNPPPSFEADEVRVVCVLPAHPRHAALRDLRHAEEALALGELERAREQVDAVLARDPLNFRAIQLFAEVHHARRDHGPVLSWVRANEVHLNEVPPAVLVQLAEALTTDQTTADERKTAGDLLARAARGRLGERDLRRLVVAMIRARDEQRALDVIDQQLLDHPELHLSPSLRQLRGDALIGLAKKCRKTATTWNTAPPTRERAWRQFDEYLDRAERELRQALVASVDDYLTEQIRRNIDFLEQLRRQNPLSARSRR